MSRTPKPLRAARSEAEYLRGRLRQILDSPDTSASVVVKAIDSAIKLGRWSWDVEHDALRLAKIAALERALVAQDREREVERDVVPPSITAWSPQ